MTRIPYPAKARSRQHGVTLIEMMIAVAVLAILLAIAVPTFIDFRERSIVRGAAEQLVAVVADARFEAVKRNAAILVNFQRGSSDTAFCVGATTTGSCDCFEKDPSSANFCGVALYPPQDNGSSSSGQTQAALALKGAHLTTDPSAAMASDSSVTFDPLLGTLSSLTDGGSLTIQSPSNAMNYRLRVTVNALGRATLCVPSGARAVIGYKSC
jgi:type IV fimbrial biogenesis protein FimT